MSERYADQGLVIIGVHTKRGSENMAKVAEQAGIPYPLAIDSTGVTARTYLVDGRPDYYLIDRAGNLRVADLSNGDLERAVQVLLAENGEDALHPALGDASKKAIKKDKRILVQWGTTTEVVPLLKFAKSTPGLRKLIFNEFEVVHLTQIGNPKLAEAHGIAFGPTLAVLEPDGKMVQVCSAKDMTGETYMAFLEANRAPVQDAELLWSDALQQAKVENKRVLVHLGAPW